MPCDGILSWMNVTHLLGDGLALSEWDSVKEEKIALSILAVRRLPI